MASPSSSRCPPCNYLFDPEDNDQFPLSPHAFPEGLSLRYPLDRRSGQDPRSDFSSPSLIQPRYVRSLSESASQAHTQNSTILDAGETTPAEEPIQVGSDTSEAQTCLAPPTLQTHQESHGPGLISARSNLPNPTEVASVGQKGHFRSGSRTSPISLDVFPSSAKSSHSRQNSQTGHLAPQELCEECEATNISVSFCNVCNIQFCDYCWDQQSPHKKKKLGNRGDPHEKTKASVAAKVRNVLEPSNDPAARERLYRDDEVTTWFGIERPDGSRPLFQDFGRFGDLMNSTNEEIQNRWQPNGYSPLENSDQRTPSLVSFVGQTGAGKSALTKLLIDLNLVEDEEYSTPVVGSACVIDPTSEDVHLYIEPRTAYTDQPILFADCEGLEGGEREPISAKLRRKRRNRKSSSAESPVNQHRAARLISERELAWADVGKTKSREYAVTNLYPRLLYTFSDVIVFVLRNPKVIEGVFTKLVDWADAALETSSNQPNLPYAVIVLNASDSNPEDYWWDVETSTRKIISGLDQERTVDKNPTFIQYAEKWRERGHIIETVEQLMKIYYSSIQIIRVPNQGRPKLVKQQVDKLYNCIQSASQASISSKRELRMLLDTDEFQSYLQYAFTHFSRNFDTPFDFVQASFSNSPIPFDFGGNILKLAINIKEEWENTADANTIFEELSWMVASCISFDCARKKIVGTPTQIFPKYLEHLDAALENFAQSYWPCEYVRPGGGARCVNVRSGHSKGHQLKDGQVLAGDYTSKFSFENSHERFRTNVYCCLQNQHALLQERLHKGQQEIIAASEIHRDIVMAHFYQHASRGKSQFSSQTACYCCLFEPPEHILPCGHILCTSCVRIYGKQRSNTVVEVRECPIEYGVNRRYQSWKFNVYLKPKTAGIRVLTLDGGGIRGIAILEILGLIEKSMGGKLPIRYFFDLIVGTSTGGLIALALGVRLLSVGNCIDFFERLCRKAFTRRIGSSWPGVGWLIDNYNHSKYETRPLEEMLQEAFSGDRYLFGSHSANNFYSSSVKVAVTSTSTANGKPVVFANYNRPCSDKLSYDFQRPERVANELKIWEAARATSAAPGYFKPFHHEPSKRMYMDGGIRHNNPIAIAERERKLIWSNSADWSPDVVLSIGTGSSLKPRRNNSQSSSALPRGVITDFKYKMKIAKDHIGSSLDCEQTWGDFIGRVDKDHCSRFIRINPELDMNVPKLDDVKNLRMLRDTVHMQMSQNDKIEQMANRLISLCFYFESTGPPSDYSQGSILPGRIACRLPHDTKEISELGKTLRSRLKPGRDPVFAIREKGQSLQTCEKIPIPKETVDSMIRLGQFKLAVVQVRLANKLALTEITLCLDNDHFPISGFPRVLADDEGLQLNLRRTFTGNNNRWVGRANSTRKQRNHWKPPEMPFASQAWNLDSFTKPTHVLGLASTSDIQRMSENLTQGPEPPVTPSDVNRFGVFRNIGWNRRKSGQRQLQRAWIESENLWYKPELDDTPSPRQKVLLEHEGKTKNPYFAGNSYFYGTKKADQSMAELSSDYSTEYCELEAWNTTSMPALGPLYRARYSFLTEHGSELNMIAGETFRIVENIVEGEDESWCLVVRANNYGQRGLVPFEYLEECSEMPVSELAATLER